MKRRRAIPRRVIKTIDADVLGVVEAENRPALMRFCKDVMPAVEGTPYDHIMLIDGNDERGIDVGLMTKKKFNIVSIASHVDDEDEDGLIYSRDCAQFEIETADGNTLIVLANHFKSKGFGTPAASNAKRKRQAARTADDLSAAPPETQIHRDRRRLQRHAGQRSARSAVQPEPA